MFAEILIERIRAANNNLLIADRTRRFSGKKIDILTADTALRLLEDAVKPGDRVGVAYRDPVQGLIVFIAALRVGAVPVFIDFRMKPDQCIGLIELMGLIRLYGDRQLPGRSESVVLQVNWAADPSETDILIPQPQHSNGFIALSSGTTGIPKAYVLNDTVISNRMLDTISYQPREHKGLLVLLSLSFAGMHNLLFPALLNQVPVHFMPLMFSTNELISMLKRKDITGVTMPPPILMDLLDAIGPVETPAFEHLRLLKCAGAPVTSEVAVKAYTYLSNSFEKGYGSTLSNTNARLLGDDIIRHPDAIGRLCRNIRLEVLDPLTLEPLPVGGTGILAFHSNMNASDIFSSTPTDERIIGDAAIPGDIGYMGHDGLLYVTGRMSDVIVRGGIAILPKVIEDHVRSQPGIRDIAIVGVDDLRLGQEIVAFVVAEGLSEAEVEKVLISTVDQDKRPRRIVLVNTLPVTVNGKLDRLKLRTMVP